MMLDQYLKRMRNLPALSVGGEAKLSEQIEKGDREALARLVKGNKGFVVGVAKQFQGQGLSLANLVAEGNAGLIKAAKRFDGTKGYKFSSYAVLWIRQTIMMALAEQSQNRQQRR
jgi:RNA polymerase primary sigma factor